MGAFSEFVDMFPNLRNKLSGIGGQQPSSPSPNQAQPVQSSPSGSSYPGFPLPAFSYHNLPNFNLGQAGGFTPAQGGSPYNFNGGALNLPGWALQQSGGTGASNLGGWKPSVTSQNVNGGGGSGGSDAASILSAGYGYHPEMGFVSLSPDQKWQWQNMQDGAEWGLKSNPEYVLSGMINRPDTAYGF